MRVKTPPKPGETVLGWDFQEPMDGGKGSNQAIAAARLGAQVTFVGCVGDDRIGHEGERWMQDANVDTTWLKIHPNVSSGIGFILLDENGIPAMVTSMGANAELSHEHIRAALEQTRGAGVLLTQFEIPVETAIYAARLGKEMGLRTIVNPAPAPDGFPAGLENASILTPNEIEAKTMLGLPPESDLDPREMAHMLRERAGCECVLITLGELGVVGADSNGESWWTRPPTLEVVDTSGAGDEFCAALAVGLAEGMPVRAASVWACRAASLSVTRPGTIPAYPTREEVANFSWKVINSL